METMETVATPRSEVGGGTGRRLRAQKRIPAVIYGNNQPSRHLSIDAVKFEKALHSIRAANVMIDLTVEGVTEHQRVFLRELQRDPMSGALLHADFQRIDETQKMHFSVPIHHMGVCAGVKMGGILDQHLRTLDIKCLPKDLIPHIDVDVTTLLINHSRHVEDISLPEKIEILSPPADVVFTVLPPKVEVKEVEAAPKEEEGEEPAVVGEEKSEKKGGKEGKE